MAKRTYYTTKDLVSFGEYLLSENRSEWMKQNNRQQLKPENKDQNKVFDADIANWKHISK